MEASSNWLEICFGDEAFYLRFKFGIAIIFINLLCLLNYRIMKLPMFPFQYLNLNSELLACEDWNKCFVWYDILQTLLLQFTFVKFSESCSTFFLSCNQEGSYWKFHLTLKLGIENKNQDHHNPHFNLGRFSRPWHSPLEISFFPLNNRQEMPPRNQLFSQSVAFCLT